MDKQQDQSLAITAIRETFEESGLLLASPIPPANFPSDDVLDEARLAIHQQTLKFQKFLDSHNLRADTISLLPFTQWITPIGPPRYVQTQVCAFNGIIFLLSRRFHTQFYVAFLPAAHSSGFSSGAKEERLPKHGTLYFHGIIFFCTASATSPQFRC